MFFIMVLSMIIVDEYFYKLELKYWLVFIFSYQYSMYEWLERHSHTLDKYAERISNDKKHH